MGAQVPRLTLFSGQEGFEHAEALAKSLKPPRVRYKKATYTKIYKNDIINAIENKKFIRDDEALWGEMKKVYTELAGYFIGQIPFGSPETEFDFEFVRIRKQEYTNKPYMYQGVRYKEIPDKFIEAEIKGTEALPIEDRLNIHKAFLNCLKQGYSLEGSIIRLKNELNRLLT